MKEIIKKSFLQVFYLTLLHIHMQKNHTRLGKVVKPCILSATEKNLGPDAAIKTFEPYHYKTTLFNKGLKV